MSQKQFNSSSKAYQEALLELKENQANQPEKVTANLLISEFGLDLVIEDEVYFNCLLKFKNSDKDYIFDIPSYGDDVEIELENAWFI